MKRVKHMWAGKSAASPTYFTACGQPRPEEEASYVRDWRAVTCKQCLKKRKTK